MFKRRDALAQGGSLIGKHESLILMAHVLDLSHAQILLEIDKEMPDAQCRAFFDGLKKRAAGEPLQYVLGEWEFYGLKMKTDKRALIPRPETELLVEAVLTWVKENNGGMDKQPLRVLDVCTGSGCIAVALAVLLGAGEAGVEVTAVDISPDALALAGENAALHGVGERVRFVLSDLAGALLPEYAGCFDVVVSNPPYIPAGDIAGLQAEVRDYEPRLALDGGADGMDLYKRLLPQAYALLRPGGGLFLEIGPVETAGLVAGCGFSDVKVLKDYGGGDRIITAKKRKVY